MKQCIFHGMIFHMIRYAITNTTSMYVTAFDAEKLAHMQCEAYIMLMTSCTNSQNYLFALDESYVISYVISISHKLSLTMSQKTVYCFPCISIFTGHTPLSKLA